MASHGYSMSDEVGWNLILRNKKNMHESSEVNGGTVDYLEGLRITTRQQALSNRTQARINSLRSPT